MENLMDNPVDEQQEAQGQEEQQLEQSQEGTPQEQEQPEFMLDKDGNFTWNTDEYDDKYPDEDYQPEQEEDKQRIDDLFTQVRNLPCIDNGFNHVCIRSFRFESKK